ncbi:MAG TPA: hypothetical protein VES65_11365 [Solirubrobacteraceae bacterium]|nr:hypothetical protein [Solirubrobacteraceae bacterium]
MSLDDLKAQLPGIGEWPSKDADVAAELAAIKAERASRGLWDAKYDRAVDPSEVRANVARLERELARAGGRPVLTLIEGGKRDDEPADSGALEGDK